MFREILRPKSSSYTNSISYCSFLVGKYLLSCCFEIRLTIPAQSYGVRNFEGPYIIIMMHTNGTHLNKRQIAFLSPIVRLFCSHLTISRPMALNVLVNIMYVHAYLLYNNWDREFAELNYFVFLKS